MKKIIYTLSIVLGLGLSANAQVESLSGPRIGLVYMTASPGSSLLNGNFKIFEDNPFEDYNQNETKGSLTTLYGWQLESRFADGESITGIVEWIILVGGMEKGKLLPSISSMVGARTESGLEFAVGPNLSISGISMVIGVGYNFKSGNLNIPVNFAFVPGRKGTHNIEAEYDYEEVWIDPILNGSGEIITPGYYEWTETLISEASDIEYHSGNRFSITVGFNLSK